MQIDAIAQVNNEEKFRQTNKADKRQCDFNSDAQLWPLTAVRQLLFWTQIDFSSPSLSLSLWKCPSNAVLIKPTGMHKCLWIAPSLCLPLSLSGHYQHLITLLITLLVNEDVSGSCLCLWLCPRRIGIKTPSRIRAQTEPFWIQNHCLAFRFCCGCLCRSEATKIKHITLFFRSIAWTFLLPGSVPRPTDTLHKQLHCVMPCCVYIPHAVSCWGWKPVSA